MHRCCVTFNRVDLADVTCLSEATVGENVDFKLQLPFTPTAAQMSSFSMVTYGQSSQLRYCTVLNCCTVSNCTVLNCCTARVSIAALLATVRFSIAVLYGSQLLYCTVVVLLEYTTHQCARSSVGVCLYSVLLMLSIHVCKRCHQHNLEVFD